MVKKKNAAHITDSRMADIFTHELIHTVVYDDGHGPQFKKIANALGLGGKMTSTIATADWYKWAAPILEHLGPMPYAEIMLEAVKTKKTYQHKVQCLTVAGTAWSTPNGATLRNGRFSSALTPTAQPR